MRILIYGINFKPELTGTGKYTGEMATWLSASGHDVRVVTAPPYYPQWQVQQGYSSLFYSCERIDGCRVWRCPLWVPRRPGGGATRVIHLLTFALSSFPLVLRHLVWRPQAVIVIAPTLLCAPAGWLLARLTGGFAWLHIQDFELDMATGLGMMRGGLTSRLATSVETFWLRRFDRVSTISPRMLERLAGKGIEAERRFLFPNWVNTEEIYPLPCESSFRQELGLNRDAVVALYAGNMGEKQGLGILTEAAHRLRDHPRLVFVFAGDGAAKARLERDTGELPNIRWLPLQPVDRLNDLLNLADVHLLPQRADAADLVMPSKLTGMLASGRPIIATAAPGTQIAEVVAPCGKVVPPGSVDGVIQALLALASDSNERQALGRRARQYACEHLGREAILKEFSGHLSIIAY